MVEHALSSWSASVHFLSGAYRTRRRAVQATTGCLDLGVGCALAPGPGLSHGGAVFCDIVSNDGARRTMQDALTGRSLRRQTKQDGQGKQQTKPHLRVVPSSVDRVGIEPAGSARPSSHNAAGEASLYQAYEAEELCGRNAIKVSAQRAVI